MTTIETQNFSVNQEANASESINDHQKEDLLIDKTQEKMNHDFNQELKRVYKEIDDLSGLLWSHKDQNQLIQRRDNKQKTRSNITSEIKEEHSKWEQNTNAQLGYGEITKGALSNLISVMQRFDTIMREQLTDEEIQKLPFPLEEYKLDQSSTFLDIGSGFGKPVFHASMQTYCKSKGIEVVPARVAFCLDEKCQIQDFAKKRQEKKQKELAKQLEKQKLLQQSQIERFDEDAIMNEMVDQNQVEQQNDQNEEFKEVNNHSSNNSENQSNQKLKINDNIGRSFSNTILENNSTLTQAELLKLTTIDSTYSSTLHMLHDKNQLPIGDVISLMTSSQEAIRRLEVTLPQLHLYGIDFPESFMKNLQQIRKLIDGKLDNNDFQRNSNSTAFTDQNLSSFSEHKRDSQVKSNPTKAQIKAQQKQSNITPSQNPFRRRANADNLRAEFREDWIDRTDFEVCDAAKLPDKYEWDGKDYTHVYSYNKVMSASDRHGICKILNKTNFRTMAWYFGPEKTRQDGLRNFKLIYKSPMQSTGNEKFTCYVYCKTKLFEAGVDDLSSSDEYDDEEDSDNEKDSDEEETESNDQESSNMRNGKSASKEQKNTKSASKVQENEKSSSSQDEGNLSEDQNDKKDSKTSTGRGRGKKGKKGRGRWGKRTSQQTTQKLENEVKSQQNSKTQPKKQKQ
eukprot:403330892